jgi:hypothetical protein
MRISKTQEYLKFFVGSCGWQIRKTLFKNQFMDELVNMERCIYIKQARPRSLNEAFQLAVELEAYNRAEKKYYS